MKFAACVAYNKEAKPLDRSAGLFRYCLVGARMPMRLLFCLAHTGVSGGNKFLFELMKRTVSAGHHVDVFNVGAGGQPSWFPLGIEILPIQSLETALSEGNYEMVFFANAYLLPFGLASVGNAIPVLLCQGFDSFYYGNTAESLLTLCPTVEALNGLPIPVVATSRSIQDLYRLHHGKDSYYLPLALDEGLFQPDLAEKPPGPKRILMVGNYMVPCKGLETGFEAVALLAQTQSVSVVLITQEERYRHRFEAWPFPVEIHFKPSQEELPDIYRSCDVYCCASIYEGFGLPALEAFSCGVPVVSTRHLGIADYGVDEQNILLAEIEDAEGLADQLGRVLTDSALAARLVQKGLVTAETYSWKATMHAFAGILEELSACHWQPQHFAPQVMADFAEALRQEGLYTPLEAFHHVAQLMRTLKEVCQQMDMGHLAGEDAFKTIRACREGLKAYLVNTQAETYGDAKTHYDLCQMLLGFEHSPKLREMLHLIVGEASVAT